MDKLPPLLLDFIQSVAPQDGKGPVKELQDRYEERRQEHIRTLAAPVPINHPKGSPEYLVELRIREWVHRMEAEKAEAERRKKAPPVAPPQSPPPPRKH